MVKAPDTFKRGAAPRALPLLALLLVLALLLSACGKKARAGALRVGHGGGYLSAALYAALDDPDANADVHQFNASADIAYALLSGELDIGFVEAERIAALAELHGFERLTVAGKVTYPYGASLILRKGVNARLQELGGLTIAASAPDCVLLDTFAKDAQRLGADLSKVRYEYMQFHAMFLALASGAVDAALMKGVYAVPALKEGHSILYQDWDVVPGDECCPAVIDQAILILLARRESLESAEPFRARLLAAQGLPPDTLRRFVAENTSLPFEFLQSQPVPEFSLADDELVEIFIEAANEHQNPDEHSNEGGHKNEDEHEQHR